MTDIVERLRSCCECEQAPLGPLLGEAADEIERLRAAVQAGRDVIAVIHRDDGSYRETHGDRKTADDAIKIVSSLRAERDALREDAERYRWLRGNVSETSTRWSRWRIEHWSPESTWNDLRHADLDASVDKARKA
jgi:hypothetical protein